MTIAYYCLVIAGFLPYIAAYIAKSRKDFDNSDPRGWLSRQEGFRARANAAQANAFEAFPFFAAAVIVAHLRGASQSTVDVLAIAFVILRMIYLAVYVAGLATLRSVIWLAGFACVVALFFVN